LASNQSAINCYRDESGDSLALPVSFKQVWSEGNATFVWSALCPDNYTSLGDLATAAGQQPQYFENHRCVNNDLVDIRSSSVQKW